MPDAKVIDAHVHVGLVGDRWPEWGRFSEWYRQQLTFKIFLLYAHLKPDQVCDTVLRETTVRIISTCGLDNVVCLALDPVFTESGKLQKSASHFWVANEYIIELRKDTSKVLFGASVHPYDPDFKNRVKKYVDQDAVLLKWVPSGQQINLAHPKTGEAMKFLATAKNGKPLPLLLHVGPEYAVPTSDPKTTSNDFLKWSWWERTANWFRGEGRWNTPDAEGIERNIKGALDAGATIIFAHCGLPYFGSGFFSLFEHSDFKTVKEYTEQYPAQAPPGDTLGRCFADVSAFCTPVRLSYFKDVRSMPQTSLVFGSDFPTPIFELFTSPEDRMNDFKAIMKGSLDRLVVPEDNLLDVNFRQLQQAFPGHPLFTNFGRMIG
jgi:hypothetical protein